MQQTIHEAAEAIRGRRAMPIDLVEQCLAAIERWEPHVHAWVFVDAEYARAEAKRLTAELEKGQYRGPLHGIPIGVKDIYDVFDWPTACGSKLWANSIARQDAPVIDMLRNAGAIFLGKTVTTQYASFDPPVTKNPWNLARTPGGSSSGSAAAVVTGMCLGAIGSQTGGSITRPASYCGIAGCKPTYGLVPLVGIMPLAHSMDHPGPMASCVMDLALLLRAMVGFHGVTDEPFNYVEKATVAASRPRFGRLRQLFEEKADEPTRDMMDEICHRFGQDGAEIVEVALPAGFADVIARHRIVMAVEAAQFHEARLCRHPEDYAPCITKLLEEGLACPAPEYARAKQHQEELAQAMTFSFSGMVLLCPATTGPAPLAETTGDPAFNSPWSYTGWPTISIQTGYYVEGLPLAIQLVAAPNREDLLFSVAAWCEKRLAPIPLVPKLPV